MNCSTVKVEKSKRKPSDEEDEKPQTTSQVAANEENATAEDSSPAKSAHSIPKLALLCPEEKTELLNDAKFIDKMLLTYTTSTGISSSIRGIQRHYIQARRNVKEWIRLAKSTNEQARIEDESSDKDNSKASEIIDETNDDILNI